MWDAQDVRILWCRTCRLHVWFREQQTATFLVSARVSTLSQLSRAGTREVPCGHACILPSWKPRALLLTPPSAEALSHCVGSGARRYATIPKTQKRGGSGKLFEERYGCKSLTNENQTWAIALAYIDLNAIRAGLEDELGTYRWSSCSLHLGMHHKATAAIQKI